MKLVDSVNDDIDLFATSLKELPGCDFLEHSIDTGDNPPTFQLPYRLAPHFIAEVYKQIDEMFKGNFIEGTDSP